MKLVESLGCGLRISNPESRLQMHPTNITLHRASHVLEVAFDGGETFRLPAEYLRVHSPSAEVQGHGRGSACSSPASAT